MASGTWTPDALSVEQLFDQLPVGVMLTDRAGRFLAVNDAACAVFGYSREALLSKSVADVTHPEDLARRQRELQREIGTVQVTRRRVRRGDGRRVIVEGHQRLLDEDRVLVALYDVTELCAAEETLADREQELRAMFEHAGAGAALMRPDGRLLRVNRRLSELVDRAATDLVGTDFAQLIHPRDRAMHRDRVRSVLASGEETWRTEQRLLRADGSAVWVVVTGSVLRDDHGDPVQLVVMLHDISDRKRMEDELRVSEALHRSIAEAVPDMLWMGDPTGWTTWANQRWEAYLGRSLADEVTRPMGVELLHPEDSDRVVAEWSRAARERRGFDAELRMRRHDGVYRWFLARAVPVLDEFGEIERWVGTLTDIDDRRKAMFALRDADRRKDEFLAVLSHELRNPLAPIRTGLYLLEQLHPGAPEARRTLEAMHRQLAHLTRLVDDLLDTTRISRGKIRLERVPLDLCRVVRRTVEDQRETLNGVGIDLHLHLPDQPVRILGDEVRLEQILGNLLHNARKFTPPGGSITVTLQASRDEALLEVADTGAGIEPDLLDEVFQPFVQADQALDRSSGGLGLGLPLVKGLVQLHGGTVSVHSEGPERGTTVRVTFPLRRG